MIKNYIGEFMLKERFETFSITITDIWRSLQKIKTQAMEPFGLKSSHFMCLFFLHYENRPLTAAELSEMCLLDKSAVSRIIADLIKEGYITCNEPADKRKYRAEITLTEAGKQLSQNMNGIVDEIVLNAGSGLTDENRKIFYDSLLLIASNLHNYADRTS